MSKWIGVVSLFPEMFSAVTEHGVTRRACERDLLKVETWNPRDFTHDRHRTVDDRPYGGGPGMLMKVQPLKDAITAAKKAAAKDAANGDVKVIYMSPQGRPLDQEGVKYLASLDKLIIVAGRYEGIDERVIKTEVDEEWSIGDYVLSGGELAAMVMIDTVTRMIPGALGHELSAEEDSFATGLLDCPHYTRPEEINGLTVPDVLLSGNHEAIRKWRLKQALGRTWQRRPELLDQQELDKEQQALLEEFVRESEEPGHE